MASVFSDTYLSKRLCNGAEFRTSSTINRSCCTYVVVIEKKYMFQQHLKHRICGRFTLFWAGGMNRVSTSAN